MTDYTDLTVYYRGSTYTGSATVTDPDTGILTDPVSITCGFIKSDDTVIAGAAMTKDSTGLYHYNYAIPSDAVQGVWTVKITAASGVLVKISEEKFIIL